MVRGILGSQPLKPMVHTFKIFDTNLQEFRIACLGTGESVGGTGKGLRILLLCLYPSDWSPYRANAVYVLSSRLMTRPVNSLSPDPELMQFMFMDRALLP